METTPITYIQERHADGASKLWLSHDLRGPLNVGTLVAAIRHLVTRHDALRLRLVPGASGVIGQHAVDMEPDVTLQQVVCESPEEFATHVQARLVDELQTPYDLTDTAPARFFLFRYTADHHVFCAVFSRFAVDGRSRMMIADEVWDTYARLSEGEEPTAREAPGFLPASRRLMALYEKRATTTNVDYWRKRLAPDPSVDRLAAWQARSAEHSSGRIARLRVPREAWLAVEREAAAARCTPFEHLLARTASVIVDVLGLSHLVLLTMNDFRTMHDRDVLGPFTRGVPVVLDREHTDGAAITITQVQGEMLRARVHGYTPTATFEECYRVLERDRAFAVPRTISFSYLDHTALRAPSESVSDLRIGRGPGVPDGLLGASTMDVVVNVQEVETYIQVIFNAVVFRENVQTDVMEDLASALGVPVKQVVDE